MIYCSYCLKHLLLLLYPVCVWTQKSAKPVAAVLLSSSDVLKHGAVRHDETQSCSEQPSLISVCLCLISPPSLVCLWYMSLILNVHHSTFHYSSEPFLFLVPFFSVASLCVLTSELLAVWECCYMYILALFAAR